MKNEGSAVAVIGCLGLVPAIVLGFILRAWAIVTLWDWFITPTWGLAAPKYAVCLGLSTLIHLLVPAGSTPTDKSNSTEKTIATLYSKVLLSAPIAVGCGWVFRHWM